jgi:hypothetical protein
MRKYLFIFNYILFYKTKKQKQKEKIHRRNITEFMCLLSKTTTTTKTFKSIRNYFD